MLSPFWGVVASNAVVAGVLAIFACLVGRIWKNPAALHLLWLAVLLKLFTPPVATVAIPAWIDHPAASGVLREPTTREVAAVHPRPETPGVDSRSQVRHGQSRPGRPHPLPAVGGVSIANFVIMSWLIGSMGLALGYAIRIGRFRRAMRSFEVATEDIRLLVADVSARVGLRRVPEVLTTDLTVPPLVWSLGGPPCLVVPRPLFSRLGLEGRSAILLHELAHIQRRDHLVRRLEVASKVAFWWHPAVWWAGRRLRELEEECCDGRVVESAPRQARAYALALLETFDFLSGSSPFAVPLPTAIRSSQISRRIHMIAQPRIVRLKARAALVAVGFLLPPLTLGFVEASAPRQEGGPPAQESTAERKPAPAIVGRVTNSDKAPVVGALVRAVIPASDLRLEPPLSGSRIYEAHTDGAGAYRITFADIQEPTTASVEVLSPGYVRSSGHPMMGGDHRRSRIAPGGEAQASFQLTPSRYFKGVAVDDDGKPVADALLNAQIVDDSSSGWVESTRTSADGSFELYNYSETVTGRKVNHGAVKAPVIVTRPEHVRGMIDDLLAIQEDRRESIRVVLPRGAVVSGRVLNAADAPAVGVLVRAYSNGNVLKSARTDARGAFQLLGIEKAQVRLSVVSPEMSQKVEAAIQVEGNLSGLILKLQAMDLRATPKTHDVLGLKLTDLTPKLQNAYELFNEKGALIFEPGDDPEHLGIERLARGYVFWMVGNKRVGGVREFLEQVIAEAEAQPAMPAPVRVVYEFHSEDGDGNNTQYLKINQSDIDQLKKALARYE